MQVQRDFKSEIAEKLETIPIDELERLLSKTQRKREKTSNPSKWVEMIERIEAMNIPHDIGEHIRKTSREFRENFCFRHD